MMKSLEIENMDIETLELENWTIEDLGIKEWDMADYIENEEDVICHLNAAIEEKDMDILLSTIGAISRSKGMKKIAERIGVSRESLYKSLSGEGNPSFATILKVIDTLGYDIRIEKRL